MSLNVSILLYPLKQLQTCKSKQQHRDVMSFCNLHRSLLLLSDCVSPACWTPNVASATARMALHCWHPPVCQSIKLPQSTLHGAGEWLFVALHKMLKSLEIQMLFFLLIYPRCSNSSLRRDHTYWAYNYCPTSYSWLILLGLMLYLAAFAPGKVYLRFLVPPRNLSSKNFELISC